MARKSPGELCMKSSPNTWYTKRTIFLLLSVVIPLTMTHARCAEEETSLKQNINTSLKDSPKSIRNIIVQGNKHVPAFAILHCIPFKPGEEFNPLKTGSAIRNLYNELKRLRNIIIKGKLVDDEHIDLYIVVEEKWPLKEVLYSGNSSVSADDINKKINFDDIPAVEKDELYKYAQTIKQMYVEKGYHKVDINPELKINEDGTATAVFNIQEYKKSMIKRIIFKGNNHISSKKLASTIMTREEWVLSIIDKSGTFIPDRLEADRHFLELLYQSNGFLNAKVVDIDVQTDIHTGQLTIVYEIQEGEQYFIKDIKAPGNDILTEEQLLSALPIRPGQLYSRENIANSIQSLEMIWGNRGYIYTHIEPSIIPDDETHTVSISFTSDLGQKVTLNKVTIKGNKKTKDKIIRRNITLVEGTPITNYAMEDSKNRVESLGYFDQKEGVNWKTTRLSEDKADLDLLLKEAPTGNAHIKLGMGGQERDIKSPIAGISAEAAVSDRNLFGSGIQLNASARFSKDERSFLFSLADPWLFDKPLFGKLDAYYRSLGYDEFHHTLAPINERDGGANVTFGFVTNMHTFRFLSDTFIRLNVGVDSVRYPQKPISNIRPISNNTLDKIEAAQANEAYQGILDKLFKPGEYVWLTANMGQDTKNHPTHPSRGHTWLFRAQLAVPALGGCIGFNKFDLDFNWFTPLINEYDLVLHLHSFIGVASRFRNNLIPYRELFNIGGPASVRGFLFGQIGPQFFVRGSGDSIGGSKAFFWNAELLFPITPDFNLKGLFFYDGGAGWDNPYIRTTPQNFIRNNNFDYRHAVGFGIRLYNPVPVRIDVGFKLDARKDEKPYEVHFGMAYDW